MATLSSAFVQQKQQTFQHTKQVAAVAAGKEAVRIGEEELEVRVCRTPQHRCARR